MSLTTSRGMFLRNGKPHFLISGEIHYFRLDPRLWERHLRLLKATGANTASTYIPWDWHQPEPGVLDVDGTTHPARNLRRFIDLCSNIGLDVIVKPGPYILAEYELHGLPSWLLDRCSSSARALDKHGNVIAPDLMCYMSEEFLRSAFQWYDNIMPVIAARQHSRGGPIVMMQVCNEVGVFQWLSGQIDYNPTVVRLYREFLGSSYRDIEDVNRLYGTAYRTFDEIDAPTGVIHSREEYCAYYDFHLFYRHYFALYLDTLAKKIRSFGIDVQLSHNIPGWIFGNAAELPMLISTYEEVLRTRSDMTFGLDHIPEFVSYRNAHSDLACNKILAAMQPNGPVWAAEFQAGTREHFVKNDPADMELFYIASLAHGLRGLNYYMFSQGVNPPGKGFYGKMFYHQTPVDARGRTSPLYPVTKKVGAFIRKEKENLLASETRVHICAGLYKPYFYTELTTSQMLREKRLFVGALGLTLDPKFVREELFFNGLLRGLQTLNFGYEIRDLETSRVGDLLRYRQLWVITTEWMDAVTQSLLASYVNSGGHLVVTPAVPTMDNHLLPCTVLADALGVHPDTRRSPPKVTVFGIPDVYSHLQEKQVFAPDGCEVVATTKTGDVCGIQKNAGKGKATVLGFAFGYTTDEHLALIETIVSMEKIRREARVSDPDIQVVVRHGAKASYTFLLNYHNRRKTFTVNGKPRTLGPLSYTIIKT